MSRLLKFEGYDTLCATNGMEALHILQSATPAAILLDLAMPVMGGLALLKVIRRIPHMACIPVIVISGETADMQLEEAKACGATAVLVKCKFGAEELLELIRRLVTPEVGTLAPALTVTHDKDNVAVSACA
jgi:CheY-like chemotaxis protein